MVASCSAVTFGWLSVTTASTVIPSVPALSVRAAASAAFVASRSMATPTVSSSIWNPSPVLVIVASFASPMRGAHFSCTKASSFAPSASNSRGTL